ncbi:ligand-binding sensor domain-containing protein [Ferruginibacter sp.]
MKWKLLLIINFSYCIAAAQQFRFNSFTTKEGLSNNTIACLIKNNQGFLWMGTANGLNRFDGNAFDVFNNNPNDSNSIASNFIQSLYISSKNKLWVGTASGISTFNEITQTFSNYSPDTLAMPKIGQAFVCINEDDEQNIWIGSWYDLLIFNPATKKFKTSGWANYVNTVKPANGNHRRVVVLSITKKDAGDFWVLTTYGLFSVNTHTLKFTYYPCTSIDDFYGSSICYTDENKNLWINTFDKGFLLFNTADNSFKKYTLPKAYLKYTGWDNVNDIQPYNEDTLILSAYKSIIFFDKKQEKFLQVLSHENNKTVPLKNFSKIIKDGGAFWLLSDDGLHQLYNKKPDFNFNLIPGLPQVYKLFYSTGTNQIVAGDFFKTSVFFNAAADKSIVIKTNPAEAERGVRAYTEINSDTAYLCTDQNLYLVNPTTLAIKEIPLPKKIFADNPNTVRNIVADKSGILWIRFRAQGIYQLNPKTGTGNYADFIIPEQNKEYAALYYDSSSNSIFVSVPNEGIYIYSINKKTTEKFVLNIPPSQKAANITCITGNNKGEIYLSEVYNGLYVYNIAAKKFKRYTIFDGLLSNNCNWLCIDINGFLWIATNSGISCFNTSTQQFKNFGKEQGHAGFADYLTADNNGTVYQPLPNGYLSWNSATLLQQQPFGKIYLRHCTINDKNTRIDSVYNFTAAENNISFQFGYLLQNNNEPVNFEYSLNNNNWLPVSNNNKISFSNLSPNIYFLKVRQKNVHQVFTVHFAVHPPFYKTWWFITLLFLLLALLVYFLFKRRVAAVKKQAALKQKITETETMALRAQMNPHFIFNCISSIDNFILDNDKENASNYLNKFAKLIRNILDNSKNDVIPFWKDWETLQLYLQLEQLRSNNKFNYTLNAGTELLNGHYKIPPLIIQPYIENAIHHGLKPLIDKHGQLQITAAIKDGMLQYIIKDNGVGRDYKKDKNYIIPQHQSYGMQLTKERIELFNEQKTATIKITDLKDTNGNAAGTEVVVFLKV